MQNILMSLLGSILSSATVQQLIAAELQKLLGSLSPFFQQAIAALMHTTAPTAVTKVVSAAPSQAIKNVQHLLNTGGFGPLTEDGYLGPKTAAALTAAAGKFGLNLAAPPATA